MPSANSYVWDTLSLASKVVNLPLHGSKGIEEINALPIELPQNKVDMNYLI